MTDKHFVKEFEKAKARKAHPNYLSHIYALSLIDGSHKAHQKAIRSCSRIATCRVYGFSKSELLKLAIGKAWAGGFEFAYINSEKLNQAKKECEKKMDTEFIQSKELFYQCNTCGRLEQRKIGLSQKRHKNCKGYTELTMPVGTAKALSKWGKRV